MTTNEIAHLYIYTSPIPYNQCLRQTVHGYAPPKHISNTCMLVTPFQIRGGNVTPTDVYILCVYICLYLGYQIYRQTGRQQLTQSRCSTGLAFDTRTCSSTRLGPSKGIEFTSDSIQRWGCWTTPWPAKRATSATRMICIHTAIYTS